jgi:hypothetical protein
MTRFFLIFTTILLINSCILAQHYKTAGGIRLGNEIGLTVQQVVKDKTTVEGIFATHSSSNFYNFTALGERHYNLLSRRINFYTGAGAHFGLLKKAQTGYENTFGITGIGGMEMTIKRLNFSFDFKPAINIFKGDSQNRWVGQFALSVRYVFVERESFVERVKGNFRDRFKRKK